MVEPPEEIAPPPEIASRAESDAPAPAVGPMRAVPAERIPAAVRHRVPGAIVHAVGWTDRNGENLAVFSRRETTHRGRHGSSTSAQLTIQHFLVESEGRVKGVRSLKEAIDRCEAELLLAFRDTAYELTDLDEDGIGELTFAYTRACRKNASPPGLKLLMLEDGTKYILRGTMRDERGRGGEHRVDPSFEQAPEFLEHAKQVWAKVS